MAQTLSGMFAKVLDRVRGSRPAKPAAPAARPSSSARPTSGRGASTSGSGAPTVDDPSLAGVTFEYNPSLDGDADPGEVVWTWVPWEEDPTQGKDRPVVIVGRREKMLVGVPLTSKAHDNERQVLVGTGPWDREGRPSYAKIERILDVDPGQVRREGAILSRAHYDDVVAALRRS